MDDPEHASTLGAVMLCDVESSVGSALTRTVASAGFVIRAMTTRPTELSELTVAEDPDVVVVDLALSGQAGTSLLATIHSAAPRCPLLATTALAGMDGHAAAGIPALVVDRSDLRPLADALRQIAKRGIDHRA